MQQLNINESLRIYIPGLILCLLAYLIIHNKLEGAEVVALPAIFIGFIFNLIFGNLHKRSFNNIISEHKYAEEWKEIILHKLDINKVSSKELSNIRKSEAYNMMVYIEFAFVANKYNSPELAYFRYPKSIGVMYFNLAVVSLISIIVSIITLACNYNDSIFPLVALLIIPFLALFAFFSFKGSRRFFANAIERELYYWRGLNKSQMDEIMDIVRLWIKTQESKTKNMIDVSG